MERNPAFAEALKHSLHDIAGHGLRWFDYRDMPEIEEREHIHQTLQIIHQTLQIIHKMTGKQVQGWYTGRKSENTRRLIIEEGLKYDSDDYSDDYPFWITTPAGKHLIIPYTLINNDIQYCLQPGWNSPQAALDHLKMTFDCLLRESQKQPMLMTIGLHARLSGHPGRTEAMRQFIQYALKHPDACFLTRERVADAMTKEQ